MMAALPVDAHRAPHAASALDQEATPEEVYTLLDQAARRYLKISGQEFLRRWRSGHYDADPDQPGVLECVMLVPFVRDTASV